MFQDFKIAYVREHVRIRGARKLSFLRQSVAHVLSQAAAQTPHAAGVNTFDVTPLVEYCRAASKGLAGEAMSSEKLLRRAVYRNYSAFFIKAIAHSLHHCPDLNGFIDYAPWRTAGVFYQAEDINISFTVHTKFGVVKPIMRNPHLKPVTDVADEMRQLTRKARRTDMNLLYKQCAWDYMKTAIRQVDVCGLKSLWMYFRAAVLDGVKPDPEFIGIPAEDQLGVADVLGSTLTVANIGSAVDGHQTVTVIIPPEIMMLGIGDVHLAPWVVDGQVVPRHVVTIACTIDHRVLDGGDIFPMAPHLNRYLNNPALIYDWTPEKPI